jgi:carboxyl-terminal processing protease
VKYFYLCALCLLLQACGGGGSASAPPQDLSYAPASCSVADQRQSLRAFMQDQYYWNRNLAAANEAAADMDGYFRSMLDPSLDHYSFAQPTETFNQVFAQGQRVGYGYVLVWADAAHTALRVRSVEPLSPVGQAGLKRGDVVAAVDGLTPEQVISGRLPAVSTPGVTRTFTIVDTGGTKRDVVVKSALFDIAPLEASATLDAVREGVPVKVGYLAYHQFVGYNLWELALVMSRFSDAGVGEVILDLRYNGGGSIPAAQELATMIGGARLEGQVFTSFRFNEQQSRQNVNLYFGKPEERLAALGARLSRVIVIGSFGTASASELVINGLRPFMPVVLVGETTFGKPYGFMPLNACGTTYNAVQFETINARGVGGYTAGFAPDCLVPDDLDHQLGDPQEARTRAALDYIATGRCNSPQALNAQAPVARRGGEIAGETVAPQMFAD